MIDDQRKQELLGDGLAEVFTVEYLCMLLPDLAYNQFHAAVGALTSNEFMNVLGKELRLEPIVLPHSRHPKAYARAFETHIAQVYLRDGRDDARIIVWTLFDELLDLPATIATFSATAGISFVLRESATPRPCGVDDCECHVSDAETLTKYFAERKEDRFQRATLVGPRLITK